MNQLWSNDRYNDDRDNRRKKVIYPDTRYVQCWITLFHYTEPSVSEDLFKRSSLRVSRTDNANFHVTAINATKQDAPKKNAQLAVTPRATSSLDISSMIKTLDKFNISSPTPIPKETLSKPLSRTSISTDLPGEQ